MTATDLSASVRAWVEQDPDPRTAAELRDLLSRSATDPAAAAELSDRFAGRLAFGTAGLRGALGGGPNRMNRVVVIAAAAGLAAYLRDHGLADRPVVVGYDARHNSRRFATDTAEVMAGAGVRALLLPEPLPTPVLAFAVRHLGCSAGVMVTASHNPPQDNGYKVYLGDGSQIVPPADAEISQRIAGVEDVRRVPRGDAVEILGPEVLDAYVDAVSALPDGPRALSVVYTPLHGIGAAVATRALAAAGFDPPQVVAEQAQPDPDFPTVAFPNPEEPGAMDLALDLAGRTGADLVVANDPDADRCAVAVPVGTGWRMLRGDEVGVLLADLLLREGRRGVFATTIVSSSQLAAMARRARVAYAETLTGFKWLGRVRGLAYAYEEALGYCVSPDVVRDKDGISALLRVVQLAAGLKADGRTLLDRLDELTGELGVYATDQMSVRVERVEETADVLDRLLGSPPDSLGGLGVESTEDLSRPGGDLPPTPGVRFRLEDGARVVVRPSGTEPKLKCYLEVVVPADERRDIGLERTRDLAAERLEAIRTDLDRSVGYRSAHGEHDHERHGQADQGGELG